MNRSGGIQMSDYADDSYRDAEIHDEEQVKCLPKWDAAKESSALMVRLLSMTEPEQFIDIMTSLQNAFAAGVASVKSGKVVRMWAIECFNGTFWYQLYPTKEEAEKHLVSASDRLIVPVEIRIVEEK